MYVERVLSMPFSHSNLASNTNGLEEVGLAGRVNDFLGRVVPVEVHDRLLKAQQVVDSAVDYVHRRGVSCLCPQVVLPVWRISHAYK